MDMKFAGPIIAKLAQNNATEEESRYHPSGKLPQ
jgi:hypothetical protein